MNEFQYQCLEDFYEKIKTSRVLPDFEYYYDDQYLLKFLRARKFDVNNSFTMFSNFIKWRADNDVDNVEVSNILSI